MGWACFAVAADFPNKSLRLENEGGDVVASTPEQFAAYIRVETAKWAKVVKEAKVKAE